MMGDLDNDGESDVIGVTHYASDIYVRTAFNNGAGAFTQMERWAADEDDPVAGERRIEGPFSAELCDLNGDAPSTYQRQPTATSDPVCSQC